MSLGSNIVIDSPAARRVRRLAPWVILLARAALTVTPGIITELDDAAITRAAAGDVLGS